jgi:hypothetical protein
MQIETKLLLLFCSVAIWSVQKIAGEQIIMQPVNSGSTKIDDGCAHPM